VTGHIWLDQYTEETKVQGKEELSVIDEGENNSVTFGKDD